MEEVSHIIIFHSVCYFRAFSQASLFLPDPFEEVPEGALNMRVDEMVHLKWGWRGRSLDAPSTFVDMDEAEKASILAMSWLAPSISLFHLSSCALMATFCRNASAVSRVAKIRASLRRQSQG